jgi:hypothetical protein
MNRILWLACAGFYFFLAPAQAASCRIITYYSEAAKEHTVGTWSNCPGQKGLKGKRSKYKEIETVELRSPAPGPGSLPCEFLAKGCSAIPKPRN